MIKKLRNILGLERKATTSVLDEIALGYAGSTVSRRPAVTPRTAERCSTWAACVRVIKQGIGQIPIFEYTRTGETKQRTYGWLNALLHDSPNTIQTPKEFKEQLTADVLTHGLAAAYKVIAGGRVVELVPIPGGTVEEIRSGRTVTYRVREDGGGTRDYAADRLFILRDTPSLLSQCTPALQQLISIERYTSGFFTGGGARRMGLFSDMKLDPAVTELIKARWVETYGNPDHTADIAVFGMGLKPENIGLTLEEAQLDQLKRSAQRDVAAVCRVPLHLLADYEQATFSNIEHLGIEFVKYTLAPLFELWEQSIQRDLIPAEQRETTFVEFRPEAFLRGDLAAQTAAYIQQIQWGILSRNEVRALMNLNPVPGGDEFILPQSIFGKVEKENGD